MKKAFRLSIGKKIALLSALLSLVLILVSVTVASAIFVARIKQDARAQCSSSADSLGAYFADLSIQITPSGNVSNFVAYYVSRLDPIYQEEREEIEKMSAKAVEDDAAFLEKRSYFADLTDGVFNPTAGGFGMSYDKTAFKNLYPDVIEEMERMASVEGMSSCKLFYYDSEHGNFVFLCDSTATTSWTYCFPASVQKATDEIADAFAADSAPIVASLAGNYIGYAPVEVDGEVVAYVSFVYSIDRLVKGEREFAKMLVAIMVAASVAIVLIYLLLAHRWLIKNVTKLSEVARAFTSRMKEGEIAPIDAEIKTNDEIHELSQDFFALQNKVIDYSRDIANKSAEQERMSAELNIASKIQLQSLPDKPLVTPNVRVSSLIKPAKEVGGDLFDYFLTDENKLFFVIADVSGKGVPAALFMMRGKEIIRSCAKAGMSAEKIAAAANKELCQNNKEGLFITAFIGIYDDSTGLLTFVRAGHEQPFLVRDGVAAKIGEESNFVLGAFDKIDFRSESVQLKPDDRLLLYTDGLNEGINESNEEFGYDRIREVLQNTESDVLDALYQEAVDFAKTAQQFDDITMLLLEKVPSDTFSLVAPTFDDIPVATDRINTLAKGCERDKIAELDIILDELLNNAISYAFEGVKKPRIDVDAKLQHGVLFLTLVDNGTLFDPLRQPVPNTEADLSSRPEGGVGITLVRSLADHVAYRVADGKNKLTITKTLKD